MIVPRKIKHPIYNISNLRLTPHPVSQHHKTLSHVKSYLRLTPHPVSQHHKTLSHVKSYLRLTPHPVSQHHKTLSHVKSYLRLTPHPVSQHHKTLLHVKSYLRLTPHPVSQHHKTSRMWNPTSGLPLTQSHNITRPLACEILPQAYPSPSLTTSQDPLACEILPQAYPSPSLTTSQDLLHVKSYLRLTPHPVSQHHKTSRMWNPTSGLPLTQSHNITRPSRMWNPTSGLPLTQSHNIARPLACEILPQAYPSLSLTTSQDLSHVKSYLRLTPHSVSQHHKTSRMWNPTSGLPLTQSHNITRPLACEILPQAYPSPSLTTSQDLSHVKSYLRLTPHSVSQHHKTSRMWNPTSGLPLTQSHNITRPLACEIL